MQEHYLVSSALSRFQVLPYHKAYAAQISLLFHLAVQGAHCKQYSQAQLNAWSYQPRSAKYWHLRLSRTKAWVIVDYQPSKPLAAPLCCGFINLETQYFSRGYIDCLYVHPAYQGQGLAKQLYQVAELWAIKQHYPKLTVDASYLSKPLFECQGFNVEYKTYQPKSGQMLPGFYMSRDLP